MTGGEGKALAVGLKGEQTAVYTQFQVLADGEKLIGEKTAVFRCINFLIAISINGRPCLKGRDFGHVHHIKQLNIVPVNLQTAVAVDTEIAQRVSSGWLGRASQQGKQNEDGQKQAQR